MCKRFDHHDGISHLHRGAPMNGRLLEELYGQLRELNLRLLRRAATERLRSSEVARSLDLVPTLEAVIEYLISVDAEDLASTALEDDYRRSVSHVMSLEQIVRSRATPSTAEVRQHIEQELDGLLLALAPLAQAGAGKPYLANVPNCCCARMEE
jgi:hypothetical protein